MRVTLPKIPLLHPQPEPLDEPIRAELFGIERLEQHAESLAAAQSITDDLSLGRPLLPRVEENGRVLREANRDIADAIARDGWITPASEWLVDNFFIVDEQLREIRDDLPDSFYHELPMLADGPLVGYPRVFGIAWAFVAHTDSRFDPDTLRRFVNAYQRVQPLTIGELWAVAIALRVTLVENLRRLSDAMVRGRAARQEADALADDLLGVGEHGIRSVTGALHRAERAPLRTAFAVELLQRLRDQDPAVTPALAWLHQRLSAQGTTPEEIALVEHQRQAAMTVTVRNIITSMRLMSALDWSTFFESVSLVDELLRKNSTFSAMDFVSRDNYRHAIEELSRGSEYTQLEVAQEALAAAARAQGLDPTAHPERDGRWTEPGFYLIGGGRREFERTLDYHPKLGFLLLRNFVDAATPGYLSTLLVITVAILGSLLAMSLDGGLSVEGMVALGLLAIVPASDLAIALVNRIVTSLVPPSVPPRLELLGGVPAEFRTIVVVPTLLTNRGNVEEEVERLEVHYLANDDGDVRFALLSDWSDAPTEHMPSDDELLVAAREGIARLNASHGPAADGGARFLLYHRARRWNPREGVWMGWERKRGKLHELNRLLRGVTDTTFLSEAGAASAVPSDVRYVITLDSDTRLPIGTVRRLVGTMAHPLNRPRLDRATQRVVDGYAVMQPRVTPPLPGRSGSIFQRLSSGSSGIDPYAAAVSDVYQDLFDEGSYTGKGIYDIDAFEASLADRVPENALLSHDLFEGLFARACLLTETELFEAAPSHYLAAAKRQHRWARGDWQLLPWILRERVSAIGRWKMIDNLRRTLLMPSLYLLLVAGWAWPHAMPLLWTAFVLMVITVPALFPVITGLLPRRPGISKRSHLRAVGRDFRSAISHALLTLTMMAHQAWLMADAIVRTLWRLTVSHRLMLQWTPAAHAALRIPLHVTGLYQRMAGGLMLTMASAITVAAWHPSAWPLALPILALWAAAPAIAHHVSLPGTAAPIVPFSPDDARTLRLIARRTWRYFTAFVTPESHALPPDNFQETPNPVIAQRTSPTNIGLYLLSAVAARDFGWIGTLDLIDRLEATLQTIHSLEHHRGHLYNWYGTTDGRPLDPRYVSSVDSGNFAGALITLGSACREIADQGVIGFAMLGGIEDAALLLQHAAHTSGRERALGATEMQRLDDALDVVMTVVAQSPRTPTEWAARLAELESASRVAENCARNLGAARVEMPESALHVWADALRSAVETHARDLDTIMPWAGQRLDAATIPIADALIARASLAELPDRCGIALRDLAALRVTMQNNGSATQASLRLLDAFVINIERSAAAAAALLDRLAKISTTTRDMVAAMQFGFLLDSTRMLFSIGYRVNEGSLDAGRYDLLASEARLMSFIAIAKGDVPVQHWFRLGRPLTPVGRDSVLQSWSGSMFEYLMPGLVMRSPVGSLLEQTCRLVVRRQIDYGYERGVPWGVSESGYSVRDLEMTYQYSNFGVPGLGLRRGLADDMVITPYATGLAAMVEPALAVRNFGALADAGADGHYGFYESLDYTAPRLPADQTHTVVRMYMAHHQGMLIVAAANALDGGVMRARFHEEPMVRASELLLQERTPRDVAVARPAMDSIASMADVRELVPPNTRRFTSPHSPTPRTQLLSNGHYAVMLTAAGSGYSRWRELAITRWHDDPTCDDTGSYIFLRDVVSGESWSAGYQPSGQEPENYDVVFSEDRAEFSRRDGALATRLEVIVSSEDDAEVRRVSVTNFGSRTREIEVTSYAEIVLALPASDAAHPAFSNLFVHTECIADRGTLLATRRTRSSEDQEVWLAHVLAVEGETVGDLEWETDRSHFIGRGRRVRTAQAVADGVALSNTVGSVLDPIVALRRRIRVRPGKTVRVAFSTVVASTRSEVLDLADKYDDVTTFERVATLAWTQAQVQLHHCGISPDEAHLFQTLGGAILYPDRARRAPVEILMRQDGGAAALWPNGISGDLPIVLIEIDDAEDIGIVRQLLRAHEYWRMKRLAVDLVILNNRAPSYVQDLQTLLETIVRTSQSMPPHEGQEARGRVTILRDDRVTATQLDALRAAARVTLSSRRGTLAAQMVRAPRTDAVVFPVVRRPKEEEKLVVPSPVMHPELEYFNGLGGFAKGGREYVTILRRGQWTPAPWVNVIANPNFGFLTSESGSGYTWSINSQENQLTAWSNDPVSDPPSEMMYVRDDETGELWSPTPLPIREDDGEYIVHHGHGYSRFEYDSHGIALELVQFVPTDDPVKISRLSITNNSSRARRLSVTAYLEWILGPSRSGSAPFVITEFDPSTNAMFARNSWSRDFSNRIAFADLGGKQTSWTADRTEFIGRNGTTERPAALSRRDKFSGRSGAALDPCCAMRTTIELAAGASAEVHFFVGQAATREESRALILRYRSADLGEQLTIVTDNWERILSTVQIKTPDRSLDLLSNGWLLYQTLSSRLWARAGFYQASGAFGFRDQLQDVMSLMVARSDLARAQILKAASRQFVEGDVQHWWHEPAGRGVRTRISDDLLWLPFVTSHYLTVTGDLDILHEKVAFLDGPMLSAGQLESYFEPRLSIHRGTVMEHCARAIDRCLTAGVHGLPLMGTGDWNDGMNRVGADGKGESVWLAWFLHAVLTAWIPIAEARGEGVRAAAWRSRLGTLKQAVEDAGWDGEWYRRAYFDDGTPLGTAGSEACAIDSIAQSWSVLSGAGDPERARRAMTSVDQRLVRRDDRLVLLLTPPFDKTRLEPGYIKGYVPGVRENGGQYTHAGAWVVMAHAALGDGDKAAELLSMLNPITHTATPGGVQQYKVEPYVVAGDVYSQAPHVGRGGWTWYTGSAGWLYRAGLEGVLGFRVQGQRLVLDPCIPAQWKSFEISFRYRSSQYEIVIENPRNTNRGVSLIELDGIALEDRTGISLVDDHTTHHVRVVL